MGENNTFERDVQRLYQLTLYGRWLTVAGLWLSIGALSLWGLRSEITLLVDHFTWTAIRYGLAYNPFPAFGLLLCMGLTTTVLIRHSSYILLGISEPERQRLENQVLKIRQQGQTHPLWKWIYR
ncbi:MAG: hypothetical protein F6K19_05955 [Cyanothece sp. SIO1E1]|nr:hypothetical protein [Cyanothece sp. SIO1E1]